MEAWQNHISEGNQLYKNKEYKLAEQKYWQALKSVKANFSQWHTPETAVTSLLITYRNLSDSHIKQDQIKRAGATLIQAFKIFKNIQQQIEIQSAWHKACEDGIEEIKVSIIEFLERNPTANICQGCYQKIFGDYEEFKQKKQLTVIH